MRPLAVKPLTRDIKTNVVVIGAGISGALIADALSDAGLQVVIVDRRGAVKGSTPASTALLQYEIDTPLSLLGDQIGREKAERIWRRSRLALDALRQRSRHLGIAADLVNRDSLYLEGDVLDEAGLEREACARRRAGFEVSLLDRRAVKNRFGISARSAILGYDNLSADPRRLAGGYLHACLSRGAALYAPVEVVDIECSRSSVRAHTSNGRTIAATHLVYATGYEIPKRVPRAGNTIASTWVIATKPQRRAIWPERCLIWEASDPYLYLRDAPDGRIICGGEDEEFSDEARRDALLPQKTATLQAKLQRIFPHIDATAEFAWCGSFGASKTGTPTIGPVPRLPNCYAVMGYGGNGITFSMMAAQMIRGLITGEGDADLDLVSFRRNF
jgi:glycine/D-amino acid oxidase-like deaminating enzyme